MDKTMIAKKLDFIKDRMDENEYMEVLAICYLFEREIERLEKVNLTAIHIMTDKQLEKMTKIFNA